MYGMVAEDIQVAPDKSSVAFRIHPKARYIQRRPGHCGRRQARVRHADGQGCRAGSARAVRWCGGATVLDPRTMRFDLKVRTADTIFNVGALPVFSPQVGRWAPTASRRNSSEIVTEYPITTGPYRSRAAECRPRHRVRPRPQLLGARPRRVEAAVQFRPRRLSLLPRPRDFAWRRSRPVNSTSSGILREALGAPALGSQVATTSASSRRNSTTGMGMGMQSYMLQPAPAAVPGPPGTRGAGLAYDFERSTCTSNASG